MYHCVVKVTRWLFTTITCSGLWNFKTFTNFYRTEYIPRIVLVEAILMNQWGLLVFLVCFCKESWTKVSYLQVAKPAVLKSVHKDLQSFSSLSIFCRFPSPIPVHETVRDILRWSYCVMLRKISVSSNYVARRIFIASMSNGVIFGVLCQGLLRVRVTGSARDRERAVWWWYWCGILPMC